MRNPPYLGTFALPSSSWKPLRGPWAEVAAPHLLNCPCSHLHLTFPLPPPCAALCSAVQRGAHLCAVLGWGPPGLARPPHRSALGPPGMPAPRALGFHKSMPLSFSWESPSISCFSFSGKHSPPGTVGQLSTHWVIVVSVPLASRSHMNMGSQVPGAQQIQD